MAQGEEHFPKVTTDETAAATDTGAFLKVQACLLFDSPFPSPFPLLHIFCLVNTLFGFWPVDPVARLLYVVWKGVLPHVLIERNLLQQRAASISHVFASFTWGSAEISNAPF